MTAAQLAILAAVAWPVVALALGVWIGRSFARESRRIDQLIAHADEIIAVERWAE
jgi:hypothetical protein